ncbi:hypothetical protein RFI_26195, partial [Reticulomyxa filosa]
MSAVVSPVNQNSWYKYVSINGYEKEHPLSMYIRTCRPLATHNLKKKNTHKHKKKKKKEPINKQFVVCVCVANDVARSPSLSPSPPPNSSSSLYWRTLCYQLSNFEFEGDLKLVTDQKIYRVGLLFLSSQIDEQHKHLLWERCNQKEAQSSLRSEDKSKAKGAEESETLQLSLPMSADETKNVQLSVCNEAANETVIAPPKSEKKLSSDAKKTWQGWLSKRKSIGDILNRRSKAMGGEAILAQSSSSSSPSSSLLPSCMSTTSDN